MNAVFGRIFDGTLKISKTGSVNNHSGSTHSTYHTVPWVSKIALHKIIPSLFRWSTTGQRSRRCRSCCKTLLKGYRYLCSSGILPLPPSSVRFVGGVQQNGIKCSSRRMLVEIASRSFANRKGCVLGVDVATESRSVCTGRAWHLHFH